MEKKLDASRPSSADAVNKRITKGPVTYCQQITKQEYQRQAVDFSRQEIRNLLRSIVDDRSLPSKEVTRRLAQVINTVTVWVACMLSGNQHTNCLGSLCVVR